MSKAQGMAPTQDGEMSHMIDQHHPQASHSLTRKEKKQHV